MSRQAPARRRIRESTNHRPRQARQAPPSASHQLLGSAAACNTATRASLAACSAASHASRNVVAATTLALLVACSAAPPPAPATAHRAQPGWQVRALGGASPIDPGTSSATLLDARGCASCHAAISAEWATSRHALAWTNGIFQREYVARPQAWCVNCHAPLTTQQAGQFRDAGVDCATCHVRGGAMVNARRRPGSPHATVEDPSFGSPAYCADCHQFTFPVLGAGGQATRMTEHPMQTTVASFTAGPFAREAGGCMACHGSRTNHAYAGGHDSQMLEAAVEVTWCRRGEVLELGVRNAAAGHSVPTGDIHRHLNLRAWRSSAPEALFEAFIGRRFDPADDGGKRTVWDSTIAPLVTQQHAIPIAQLGGEAEEPINLELTYVFLENELARGGHAADVSAASEPGTASVVRRRALASELPVCR